MDATVGGPGRSDLPGGLPPALATSPLPTATLGPDGAWGELNPAAAAALGDPPAPLAALLVDPGLDLAAVLARGAALTLPVRLPDGRPADAVVSPDDAGGQLVQLLDRAETEALADRLAAAADAHERFVSRVSHDLKNPIGTAQGYAELLLEDAALPDEARTFASRILSSSERALTTLVDIVTEARSVERIAPPDEVDVTALLAEVTAGLADLATSRGAVVTATTPMPVVRTDGRVLQRALEATVRNAIEHHPDGARVEIAALATATGWELVVEDDGPGIPPDEREDALTRRGLGLPMTVSALARCGGDLWLETGSAGGLRVCITLPQRRARDPEPPGR